MTSDDSTASAVGLPRRWPSNWSLTNGGPSSTRLIRYRMLSGRLVESVVSVRAGSLVRSCTGALLASEPLASISGTVMQLSRSGSEATLVDVPPASIT